MKTWKVESNLVRRCGTDAKKSFEVNGKISDLSPELIQISDTFIVYNISRSPPSVRRIGALSIEE